MKIEHDPVGQKFLIDDGNVYAILAYTEINGNLDVHFIDATDERAKEGIIRSAFEYARNSNVKIISSAKEVDEFVEKHPEYADLVEKN